MATRKYVCAAFIAVASCCNFAATAQEGLAANFDWIHAKSLAKGLQRPRSFPAGDETASVFSAASAGERKAGFAALTKRLDKGQNQPAAEQGIASTRSARTAEQKAMVEVEIKNAVIRDANTAQEAGFAALVTGSTKYRQDAMRIVLALAALDPRAETSVAKEALSAMLLVRTLALGLDWFYAAWTDRERQQINDAISVRMEDFALKLVRGTRPMEQYPLVSHDNEVLGGLAEVAVLLLGETPLADRWFDEFVPLYARMLTPFGGVDGGYANGTAYASWDVGEFSLRHWDTLRRAIGLDLTKKPWAQNFGRYLAYFLPPGTPVGLFGDAAELEMRETLSRYAKAYAYRVPTPLNRWYAAQWFQEDPAALELLTSPLPPPGPALYPAETANAALFPSIGWVALHSSLQDRSRTSFYFKSSPYGAVSHSHADQNSFVLNAGGRQLLVDSGYYDYFGSAHHYGWTKRTIAHNAVTFDGGKGQEDSARPWGEETASGKITAFSTTPDFDLTFGDATIAYRGQLKQATRGIVYLRPDVFVVFDSLESTHARKWEWNLHALKQFTVIAENKLEVNNVDVKACVNFQSSTPTTFQQTNTFPIPPLRTKSEPRPDQWHGQYVATTATNRFWSVAIINVGCSMLGEAIQLNAASAAVRVGGREFEYDGQKITVKR